jgi:hypothetical protein
MARIELRHTTVRFVDGHATVGGLVADASITTGDTSIGVQGFPLASVDPLHIGTRFQFASVNRNYYVTAVTLSTDFAGTVATAVPADAMVTITVAGFTGIIPKGATFTVTGSTRTYTVTAHTETGADTTELTFTPAFATADGIPATGAAITLDGARPLSITFTPALLTADTLPTTGAAITVLGRTVEIKVGNGNLTYTISQEVLYDLDRGDLDTVREGDEQPMSISLDLVWEEVRSVAGDTTPTPEEVLRQYGSAADWLSSASDLCEPYAIDIEVEVLKPCGGVQLEIYTFPDFRWESIDHNVSDAMLSTSGRCNATAPTIVRRAWN